MAEAADYVVLLGDVGSGKSTVVEKLTGRTGRSSDANESWTKTAESFWSKDKSLIIADTPGSNAMKEKLEHNIWIAHALNFMPVSKILIAVKAETRIDNVADNIRKYSDTFMEIPLDAVAVLVTHMDTVDASYKKKCAEMIEDELGFSEILFSSRDTSAKTLQRDIQGVCTKKHPMAVNEDNFLKLFKIHNNQRKIMVDTNQEVNNFRDLKLSFDRSRQTVPVQHRIDLIFEFQAWIEDQIIEAQKRLGAKNNFSFEGPKAANEVGHIANMTNQLRLILYSIRLEALDFQSPHGASELRKCPHCGLVWAKVQGCEGATTCGAQPSGDCARDLRPESVGVMATFTFYWKRGEKGSFRFDLSGERKVQAPRASSTSKSPNAGCGQTVTWSAMAQVPVPEVLMEGKISTEDIQVIPAAANDWKSDLKTKLDVNRMTLK